MSTLLCQLIHVPTGQADRKAAYNAMCWIEDRKVPKKYPYFEQRFFSAIFIPVRLLSRWTS